MKAKRIEAIIELLKTNPKINFVGNFEELGPCELGIAYPDYPGWVYEIETLFTPEKEYLDIVKKLRKSNKKVCNYNMLEIRAALTYFVRGERFCDGHMAAAIEGGYLLKWLTRYRELLEEENNDKKRI